VGAIRLLIDKALKTLQENKQSIHQQIEKIVNDCKTVDEAKYFVFRIDDRSWYSTYFHACNGLEELTEHELELAEPLEGIVNEAYEVDEDEDNQDAEDLFSEIHSPLIDLIVEGWEKGGGFNLTQPAYINFHDSAGYFDLKQGEYFDEDNIQHIIR
jgi:hypothetical protein